MGARLLEGLSGRPGELPLKDGEAKPFIHKFGEADFSSTIQQIADYKPDGLVSISWAGDMVTFVRQQKPYELYKKAVGFHYGNSVGLAKAMGNEMEPMWSGMDQGHPSLPPGKKFNEMFLKEYGQWVTEDTAACYYDSLFILKNAIEKAKSAKPEDIAKAMERSIRWRSWLVADQTSLSLYQWRKPTTWAISAQEEKGPIGWRRK